MCTPVESSMTQCCPKKLSQSEAAMASEAHRSIAARLDKTALIFIRVSSMLFGDGGCAYRSSLIAPGRSHVRTERGNLLVVQNEAELEPANPGPRTLALDGLMSAI